MWSYLHHLISPKKFLILSETLLPFLTGLFLLLFCYGIFGALFLAPRDYLQGDGFRIIYVHVPSAFLSIFIYTIMAVAAFVGLVWRIKMAFLVVKHSASIGANFTFLALVTGSLWGKPMWGTWWIWDARLTSELILLFLYAGILLFQSASAQKKASEQAVAILVLIGFIDVPIIHYSVSWWNTLHQGSTIKLFSPSLIDSSMIHPLLSMIGAFLIYYALILFLKIRKNIKVIYDYTI